MCVKELSDLLHTQATNALLCICSLRNPVPKVLVLLLLMSCLSWPWHMCACSSQTRALIVTLLCRMLSTQSKLMCAVLVVNVTNLHVHTQLQTSQVPTVCLKQR